jgi:hypothetical protein
MVLAIAATLWSRLAWRRELAAIRSTLLTGLSLPESVAAADAAACARIRIEALVPCRERPVRKGATDKRPGGKCWLCVTADRILVARGREARSIPLSQIRRIALSDAPRKKNCRLVIDAGPEPVSLEISRVDDMVRLMNLAVKHHVAVGYLRT